ncbi:MAG: hypothetical protein QNJ27_00120 [Simkaniaceae bacterium]|nr:hypothetical protein [Simkaniaceae bacterium]
MQGQKIAWVNDPIAAAAAGKTYETDWIDGRNRSILSTSNPNQGFSLTTEAFCFQ